jgi:hypothetical protein
MDLDGGEKERRADQNDRGRVDDRAEENQQDDVKRHHHPEAEIGLRKPFAEHRRQARDAEHAAVHGRRHDQEQDRRGHMAGVDQHFFQLGEGHAALQRRDDEGDEGAGRARFGRRHDAAIDAAEHDRDQQRERAELVDHGEHRHGRLVGGDVGREGALADEARRDQRHHQDRRDERADSSRPGTIPAMNMSPTDCSDTNA